MPNKTISCIAVVSIFAAFLCSPALLIAGEVSLLPKIGISGLYDDNVYFSARKPITDYASVITPALIADYDSEISNLGADLRVDFYNYLEHSDALNTVDQYYKINGKSEFTERLDLFADAAYTHDTTLDSELTETGTFTVRQKRDRYDLHGGLFFNFTELTRLGFDYRYRQVEYELPTSEDYNEDTFKGTLDKRLKNQLDMFSVVGSYAYKQSKIKEVNTYRAAVGWTRFYSETFTIHAFVGIRQTEQYDRLRNKKESDGAIADLEFSKRSEITTTIFGYRRDQELTAAGGVREVDRFYTELGYHLTERTQTGIDADYYLTRNINETVKEDSRYLILTPWLQYNLTEEHLLRLNYSYQHYYDEALDQNKGKDRNRIWVSFIFQFPKKW